MRHLRSYMLDWIMRNDEFKPLHRLQSTFKGFARFEEVTEGFIVACLDGEGGIVGGCVEEGGFGEIEEDCNLLV
jgi:hypothetical protein